MVHLGADGFQLVAGSLDQRGQFGAGQLGKAGEVGAALGRGGRVGQFGSGHGHLRQRRLFEFAPQVDELDADGGDGIADVVQGAPGHLGDARLVGLLDELLASVGQPFDHEVELAGERADFVGTLHGEPRVQVAARADGLGVAGKGRDRGEHGLPQEDEQGEQHQAAGRSQRQGGVAQGGLALGDDGPLRIHPEAQQRRTAEVGHLDRAAGGGAVHPELHRRVAHQGSRFLLGRQLCALDLGQQFDLQLHLGLGTEPFDGRLVQQAANDHPAAARALALAGQDRPAGDQEHARLRAQQAGHGLLAVRGEERVAHGQPVGRQLAQGQFPLVVVIIAQAPDPAPLRGVEGDQVRLEALQGEHVQVGLAVRLVAVGDELVGVVPGAPVGGRGDEQLDVALQGLHRPLGVARGGLCLELDKGRQQDEPLHRELDQGIECEQAKKEQDDFLFQGHGVGFRAKGGGFRAQTARPDRERAVQAAGRRALIVPVSRWRLEAASDKGKPICRIVSRGGHTSQGGLEKIGKDLVKKAGGGGVRPVSRSRPATGGRTRPP